MATGKKTTKPKTAKKLNVLPSAGYICAPKPRVEEPLPEGLAPGRTFAIQLVRNKWANGTNLRYHFLVKPGWSWPANQKAIVRWAFETWAAVGIGLTFTEVASAADAEIKIGFRQDGRSWSYVGTDVLRYFDQGRNMNFGWDLTTTWGKATALHEIGHALGMPHEHQNPKAGIEWDKAKVMAHFSAPPNSWPASMIQHNILDKLALNDVFGSNWDPSSIMHYPFPKGLIKKPKPYDEKGIGENVKLSAEDKAWVRKFYPPLAAPSGVKPMAVQTVKPMPGRQTDFIFKPKETRDYTIQTVGPSDSKIVLFDITQGSGKWRKIAAADDSGEDTNAQMRARLKKGSTYRIGVRLHYAKPKQKIGLLVA